VVRIPPSLQILEFIECLTSKVTGVALVARPPVTSDFAVLSKKSGSGNNIR